MKGLEYHDGVAEVVLVGDILRVGKARPVDLATVHGRHLESRGAVRVTRGAAPEALERRQTVVVAECEEEEQENGGGGRGVPYSLGGEDLSYRRSSLEGVGGAGVLIVILDGAVARERSPERRQRRA